MRLCVPSGPMHRGDGSLKSQTKDTIFALKKTLNINQLCAYLSVYTIVIEAQKAS